jgi:hemoglobin
METSEVTAEPEVEKSPYEMVGGEVMVRRIVDRFYDVMDTDPAVAPLRKMHGKDLGPMRDRLFAFLSGWLGGPQLYFQLPDPKCIVSAHKPYAIGVDERDQWMMCIRKAMEDCGVDEDTREILDVPFMRVCEAFRNR